MLEIFLNPIILCLLSAIAIIACVLLVFATNKYELRVAIDRGFTIVFSIVISSAVISPFNYLNPHSLGIATTKIDSVTVIAQFIFYPLIFFLLRVKLRTIVRTIVALSKDPFLCLLLLMAILSTFWSDTPFETFKAGIVLLVFSLTAASLALRYNLLEINDILRTTGTWITGLGTVASLLLPAIARADEGNWNGILAHKNVFAFWIALTASLWLFYGIYHPKKRWLSFGITCFCLVVMVFAGSGTAKIMFLAMVGVSFCSHIIRKIDFRKVITAGILTTIVAIPSLLWILTNQQYIFNFLGKDATLTGRTDFWPQVIDSIWKRPVFGYGYQGFWQDWRGSANPAAHIINHNGFVPPHSHSGYLEILLAFGIVGFLLFTFSLLNNIIQLCICISHSERTESEIAILLLIFILLANFSEVGLIGINHYTFFYIYLTARLHMDSNRSRKFQVSDSFSTAISLHSR
jgi:exopolysaccharide production protein ExoQ